LLPLRLEVRELDREAPPPPALEVVRLGRARVSLLPPLDREALGRLDDGRDPPERGLAVGRGELERRGLERCCLGSLRTVDRGAAALEPLRGRERTSTRDPPLRGRDVVTSDRARFDRCERVVSRGWFRASRAAELPEPRTAAVGRRVSFLRVALGREPPEPEPDLPERASCRVAESLRELPDRASWPESRGLDRSGRSFLAPFSSRPLVRGRLSRRGSAELDESSLGLRASERSVGVSAFDPSRVVRGWAILSYRSRKRRLVLCDSLLRGWFREPGVRTRTSEPSPSSEPLTNRRPRGTPRPVAEDEASSDEICRGYDLSPRVGLGLEEPRGVDGRSTAPVSRVPLSRTAGVLRAAPAPDPGRLV
jgi:hypothetical protein